MKKTIFRAGIILIVVIDVVLIFFGINFFLKQKAHADTQKASQTLTDFFDSLSKNEFEKAVTFLSSDNTVWESLRVYSSEEDFNNQTKVLENYCKSTLTCLPVNVLETNKILEDEYELVVQFLNSDGTIYIFGPCCGQTEEESPSKDTFIYSVKKIDNVFKVATPPLYRP